MARSPLGKFSNFMVRTAKFFAKLAIYFVIMYFVGGILFKQGYKLFYEYAVDPEDDTQVMGICLPKKLFKAFSKE